MSITTQQIDIIKQQIGRTPRGLRAIAHSNKQGIPIVLKMAPIVNEQPFPTLYWLSSKDLDKAISQLEAQGLVKVLEQKLRGEPEWQAQYHDNHKEYVATRWLNCTEQERQYLEEKGYTQLFNDYGIGGIKNWQQIRCLHMQYAHHLCGKNVIGQWLDVNYGLNELVINK